MCAGEVKESQTDISEGFVQTLSIAVRSPGVKSKEKLKGAVKVVFVSVRVGEQKGESVGVYCAYWLLTYT